MSALNENCLALLGETSSTGVDLNAAGATEVVIYTCPPGKTCLPTHVILDQPSGDSTGSVVTLGVGGGNCDEFRGDQTVTFGAGALEYVVITADPGTTGTPEPARLIDAGETFSIEITTADGTGVTCRARLFGILF